MLRTGLALVLLALLLASPAFPYELQPDDYLQLVRRQADTLIDKCRDNVGPRHTAFVPQMIDLRTVAMPAQRTPDEWAAEMATWGGANYRDWDKFHRSQGDNAGTANLARDCDILRSWWRLSEITGDPKYSQAADAYLRDFLAYCIAPNTGLFGWGAHVGYDLEQDQLVGDAHEMERQVPPYERLYAMSPQAVVGEAEAVYQGHFQDKERMGFNRHAYLSSGNAGTESGSFLEYAVGKIYLWATAYRLSGDPRFLDYLRRFAISLAGHTTEQDVRLPYMWWGERKAGKKGNDFQRDRAGLVNLALRAVEQTPEPWVLAEMLNHLETWYERNPNWEQGAWQPDYSELNWGGDSALLAYRLTADPKYLQWALGFGERFRQVPRPTRMMAYMPAVNIRFFVELYRATGDGKWLEQAREVADLAVLFYDGRSNLFAGTIGVSRPLYYDAAQGTGLLAQSLLELYQACTGPAPDPAAYCLRKQPLQRPTIALQPSRMRQASTEPIVMSARIAAKGPITRPKLQYLIDDKVGYSVGQPTINGNEYTFTLPPLGSGFEGGELSLSVTAGIGDDALAWNYSPWRQIQVFPRALVEASAEGQGTEGGWARISGQGTFDMIRTDFLPDQVSAPALPGLVTTGEYWTLIPTTNSAALSELGMRPSPASRRQMVIPALALAHWNGSGWDPKPTQPGDGGLLVTREAAPGVWTVAGLSRLLWSSGLPEGSLGQAVADLNGDGRLEIVSPPGNSGWAVLACIDGADNQMWLVPPTVFPPNQSERLASPLIADLDGDGRYEIVTGGQNGGILAFNATGEMLWKVKIEGGGIWLPPAAADLDSDGRLEVAMPVENIGLVVLRGDGSIMWRADLKEGDTSIPLIHEVDASSPGPEILLTTSEGRYYVFSAAGKQLCRLPLSGGGGGGVAVADLDSDGVQETVLTTNTDEVLCLRASEVVWRVKRTPKDAGVAGLHYCAAADLNGDGMREVVVGAEDGTVLCYDHQGSLLWTYDLGEGRAFGTFALADFDNDGVCDVLAQSTSHLMAALNGRGEPLWTFYQGDGGGFYYAVLADFNQDGLLEVYASTPGRAYMLRTEAKCKPGAAPWPTLQGDNMRDPVR